MPKDISASMQTKANTGQINIDKAEGIVECFVAGIGNKDSVGDIIQPGAFTESLKRRRPRVVWGHNWNDPIGKVLEIYEVGPNDQRLPEKMKKAGIGGLYARVQFNLNTDKGREAFASVAFFGTDQEWSIGYKTINATFDPARQANVLREVELYECSPVLHGANQLTGTISVKSDTSFIDDDISFDDDWEFDEKGARLRDPKGGLTAAGRRHFKRTEGSNLKPGVKGPADTPEKMRRKGSFLTRFFTNPSGPMKKPNGKPTRLALSAAAWGEPVPKNRSDAAALAAKGRRLLERYENSKKKDDFEDIEFYDEFDAFDELDFAISNDDEKCHMMGRMMPIDVRRRWSEMIQQSRRDDDDDDEDGNIFDEGLAQPLGKEQENALEMEMARRSNYPVEVIEATENTVVFNVVKPTGKYTFQMGYGYDEDSQRYMFGKPEKVKLSYTPVREMAKPVMTAKPNINPNDMYNPNSDDESLMPRIMRVIQKIGTDEKSLLDGDVLDFVDEMEAEFKAGRVISKNNMEKLKNVISMLQEVVRSAGDMEVKNQMFIECEPQHAFYAKSAIDPILEYYGAIAEVTEKGIFIKSGATPDFCDAVDRALDSVEVKALGGRIGGSGKGRRAGRFVTERFDPNAIDGDEDGLVQDGTAFERPATPRQRELGRQLRRTQRAEQRDETSARRDGFASTTTGAQRVQRFVRAAEQLLNEAEGDSLEDLATDATRRAAKRAEEMIVARIRKSRLPKGVRDMLIKNVREEMSGRISEEAQRQVARRTRELVASTRDLADDVIGRRGFASSMRNERSNWRPVDRAFFMPDNDVYEPVSRRNDEFGRVEEIYRNRETGKFEGRQTGFSDADSQGVSIRDRENNNQTQWDTADEARQAAARLSADEFQRISSAEGGFASSILRANSAMNADGIISRTNPASPILNRMRDDNLRDFVRDPERTLGLLFDEESSGSNIVEGAIADALAVSTGFGEDIVVPAGKAREAEKYLKDFLDAIDDSESALDGNIPNPAQLVRDGEDPDAYPDVVASGMRQGFGVTFDDGVYTVTDSDGGSHKFRLNDTTNNQGQYAGVTYVPDRARDRARRDEIAANLIPERTDSSTPWRERNDSASGRNMSRLLVPDNEDPTYDFVASRIDETGEHQEIVKNRKTGKFLVLGREDETSMPLVANGRVATFDTADEARRAAARSGEDRLSRINEDVAIANERGGFASRYGMSWRDFEGAGSSAWGRRGPTGGLRMPDWETRRDIREFSELVSLRYERDKLVEDRKEIQRDIRFAEIMGDERAKERLERELEKTDRAIERLDGKIEQQTAKKVSDRAPKPVEPLTDTERRRLDRLTNELIDPTTGKPYTVAQRRRAWRQEADQHLASMGEYDDYPGRDFDEFNKEFKQKLRTLRELQRRQEGPEGELRRSLGLPATPFERTGTTASSDNWKEVIQDVTRAEPGTYGMDMRPIVGVRSAMSRVLVASETEGVPLTSMTNPRGRRGFRPDPSTVPFVGPSVVRIGEDINSAVAIRDREDREMLRNDRLARSIFSPEDYAWWKLEGNKLALRRDASGRATPSWLEDPARNREIRRRYRAGESVTDIAAQYGLSRDEVMKAMITDMGRENKVPTRRAGMASSLGTRGEGMIVRDDNGKVVFDGEKYRNNLAERREERLRDLGFGDEEIAALLGYDPQDRSGFASRTRPDSKLPHENVDILRKAVKELSDIERRRSREVGDGGESPSAADEERRVGELRQTINDTLNFYRDQNLKYRDSLSDLEDIQREEEQLLRQYPGIESFLADEDLDIHVEVTAEEVARDVLGRNLPWRNYDDVYGEREGSDLPHVRRRLRDMVTDGVITQEDFDAIIKEAEDRFNDLKAARDELDSLRVEKYAKELDVQRYEMHGQDDAMELVYAIAEGRGDEFSAIGAEAGALRGRVERASRRRQREMADNWGGFASRSGESGRGLGRSREIQVDSSAVEYLRYDAGRQELLVKYSGGGDFYTFGGITAEMADELETADSVGRTLNTIRKQARFVQRGDGTITSGAKPNMAQTLQEHKERLSSLRGLDADEEDLLDKAIELASFRDDSNFQMDEQRRELLNDLSRLMNNLMLDEESAVATELNNLISWANSPAHHRTPPRPVASSLELSFSDDEILDARRGFASAIGSADNDAVREGIEAIDKLFADAKDNSLKLSATDYDNVMAALNTADMAGLQINPSVRDAFEMAAAAQNGKYISPRRSNSLAMPERRAGFASRINNGAPDDIPLRAQRELMDWARRQRNFRAVQELVRRFDSGDGSMNPSDWIRLYNYFAMYSKEGRGQGLYGTRRGGFASSIAGGSSGRGGRIGRGIGGVGTERLEGKTWDQVKPANWEFMTPQQQEDELFTNLTPERSGLRKADFDRLVREIAERSVSEEMSPAERRRQRRAERMGERQREFDALSDEEKDKRQEQSQAERTRREERQQEQSEMTARKAREIRKVVNDQLRRRIDGQRDKLFTAVTDGSADQMHSDLWDDLIEIMESDKDLTMSKLESLRDVLDSYLEDINALDELKPAERASVRNARNLLSSIEDRLADYEDDRFIPRGDTAIGERVGGGDDFIDAVERAGFASSLPRGGANIRSYLNQRDVPRDGFASSIDRPERAEVKGQATFFKTIYDSLEKEIREASRSGNNDIATALRLLQKIMDRQDTAKTGSKRTDAGSLALNQNELDQILDALMSVIDRQMEIGGSEERINAFMKFMDMLAQQGMAVFINKTVEGITSRTTERENSQGRTVRIQNS